MPGIINPRKKFRLSVTVTNVSSMFPEYQFHVQEITLPEISVETEEHGAGTYNLKTGGQLTIGNLTLNRLLDASSGALSEFFQAWRAEVTAFDGFMGDASIYKKTITITEYGVGKPGEDNTVNQHVFEGCFPVRITGMDFNRTSSENLIESVEFSVDRRLEPSSS
jgi:hypothetical protein